jgi:hypothetical protein
MFHLEGSRVSKAPRQHSLERRPKSMTSQVKKRTLRAANLTSEVIEKGRTGR